MHYSNSQFEFKKRRLQAENGFGSVDACGMCMLWLKSDRQSQVDWEPTTSWVLPDERWSDFYGISEVLVADLVPGDLLLLPANWFHHVVAQTASLSVNVWTLSTHAQSLEQLLGDAIPLYQKDWPLDKLMVLLQWYVPEVVATSLRDSAMCSDTQTDPDCVAAFVRAHLSQKYPITTPTTAATVDVACSASAAKNLGAVLGHHVATASGVFSKMPEPVRLMYLQVWVEHLAGFAVGVKGVPAFLAKCICHRCDHP